VKRIFLVFILISGIPAVPVHFVADAKSGESSPVIEVHDVKGFFENIGPSRTIVLAPGVYDVRGARGIVTSWVNCRRSEPVIGHVNGLTIRGGRGVEIMNGRNAGYVLTFDDCGNITIDGLVLGHEKDTEQCNGGVVCFENSVSVKIVNCDIYGCGLYGISVDQVRGLTVTDSTIRDCAIGALVINEGFDIRFNRCVFSGTEGHELFSLSRTSGCTVSDSVVKDNKSDTVIFSIDAVSNGISVVRTRFENNRAARLSDAEGRITFTDAVFAGNGFDATGG